MMALPDTPADDGDNVDFLAAVLGDPPDGPLNLFSIDTTNNNRDTTWADTPHELYRQALRLAATHNVWFGVAPRTHRTGGRGTGKECTSFGGMWVDLDVIGPGHARADLIPTLDDAYSLVVDFPLRPSGVLETGGGLQAWWLLTERLPVNEAAGLLERWAEYWVRAGDRHGWHIDNTWDAARVLRVPGTWNRKTDTPRPVELAVWNPEHTYGVDDLDQFLPEPPARHAEPVGDRIPYIGPARPGDHFNAAHTTSQVLEANGWVFDKRESNGNEQWVRPGKDRRQGSGATIYAEDGHALIWTDAVPGLRQRGSYDSFGLYVALRHGGDFPAATSTLRSQGYGDKPVDDLQWLIDGINRSLDGDEDDAPAGGELSALQRALERFRRNHHHGNALDRIPPPVPIVDGLVDKGTLIVAYGPPASGKSQAVVNLAAHVSLGLPWCGRPTKQGTVVYFIGEGQYGIRARVAAWCDVHAHVGEVPVDWVTIAPNLLDVDVDSVAALMFIAEVQPDLVIVDTLNRSMPGGEENGSKDISRVIAFAERVRELCGAATLFVHHAGKDVERGLRGHSSLLGAADTVLQITDAGSGRIRGLVEKEKDHPDGFDLWFRSTVTAGSVAVRYAPDIVGPPSDGEGEAWSKRVSCLKKLQLLDHGNGVSSTDWEASVKASGTYERTMFHEARAGLNLSGHVRQPGGPFGRRYTLTDLGLQAINDEEVR